MGTPGLPDNAFTTELRSTRRRLDVLERKVPSGAWISFTPTLTASPTPPTLSNNSSHVVSGLYMIENGRLSYLISIKFGTAGVVAGSGVYTVGGLPLGALTSPARPTFGSGQARLTDDSATPDSTCYPVVIAADNGTLQMKYSATYPSGTDTFVTEAAPWAWAANDRLELWGWFPIAVVAP